MELSLVSMVALCVFICFLLSPSFSLRIHISSPYRLQSSQHDDLLPMKLRLAETATHREFGEGDGTHYKSQISSFKGRVYKKGEGIKEEEDRMSDFMGMDYARVRRRRPIHNKSLTTTTVQH